DPHYKFNMDANGWLKVHQIPATWTEAFLRTHY
nr:galactose binding lectin {N-terminal} [Spodoptera exigua=beet armyworms, hemolymph, Peptide Partial, 32 aa] [Spodoptera exigua]